MTAPAPLEWPGAVRVDRVALERMPGGYRLDLPGVGNFALAEADAAALLLALRLLVAGAGTFL